ncbi:MAG: OmpH family outer membrane protein [Chitinophagaceae bacterium]
MIKKSFWISYAILWVLCLVMGIMIFKNYNVKSSTDVVSNGGIKIAYFEMDSLQNNYTEFLDTRKFLEDKENKIKAELASMENQYKRKLESLQKDYTTMGAMQQKVAQEELYNMQAKFQQRGEKLQMELANERNVSLLKLNQNIENFAKIYAEQNGYTYVIVGQQGLVYYKHPAYDITTEILQGLNKKK